MLAQLDSWLQPIAAIPWFYLSLALVIGLLVGSFLNVVIFRLPKMMEQDFRNDCCEFLDIKTQENKNTAEHNNAPQAVASLSKPASTCPSCQTKIKPWHNIPVISYCLLKGQCAYCQQSISIRYPLVELATGLLSLLMLWMLGLTTAGLLAVIFVWVLITLTMIDIDTQLLPDDLTLPLLWLGLIANYFGVYTDIGSALWGAVMGYLSLWSVFWLFKLLTGKEGMGYGDFKLLAALGAWMGWQLLPLIIVLSSFVGATIGIAGIMILGRDKNIPIPFGPYLAIAGWIAFLWGDSITQWYLQLMAV